MVAFGENKVGAVADAVEGPISNQCAASHLQAHGNTLVHLDLAAASGKFTFHPIKPSLHLPHRKQAFLF